MATSNYSVEEEFPSLAESLPQLRRAADLFLSPGNTTQTAPDCLVAVGYSTVVAYDIRMQARLGEMVRDISMGRTTIGGEKEAHPAESGASRDDTKAKASAKIPTVEDSKATTLEAAKIYLRSKKTKPMADCLMEVGYSEEIARNKIMKLRVNNNVRRLENPSRKRTGDQRFAAAYRPKRHRAGPDSDDEDDERKASSSKLSSKALVEMMEKEKKEAEKLQQLITEEKRRLERLKETVAIEKENERMKAESEKLQQTIAKEKVKLERIKEAVALKQARKRLETELQGVTEEVKLAMEQLRKSSDT